VVVEVVILNIQIWLRVKEVLVRTMEVDIFEYDDVRHAGLQQSSGTTALVKHSSRTYTTMPDSPHAEPLTTVLLLSARSSVWSMKELKMM
jgi:hypothetical protein